MDFQHRVGGKTGTGGVASASDANRDRRERLRQLALETIDLNKDPYFMKNHLGSYECKLCLTLHNNEGSYLAHTQGKKHQANLSRRAAKEAKEAPAQPAPEKPRVDIKKFIKIGRPGYKVTKQQDPETSQQSLLFQVDYPEVVEGIVPRHRFMAAYEQRVEPPDKRWQYLLFAAEPYETIAFKVPSREVDKDSKKFWTHWNKETKQFFLQFAFKQDPKPLMTPTTTSAASLRLPASLPPPPQNLPPPPNIAPRVSGPPGMLPPPGSGPVSGGPPPRPMGGPPPPMPPHSMSGGPPNSMGGHMGGPPVGPHGNMGGPPSSMGGPPPPRPPMGGPHGPPMGMGPPGMMHGPPGGYNSGQMGMPPHSGMQGGPPPMGVGPPRPPAPPMGMPPPPPMSSGPGGHPPSSSMSGPVPPPPPPSSGHQ